MLSTNVATGTPAAGDGEGDLVTEPVRTDDVTAGVLLHTLRMGDEGPRIVFCHGLFGQARNFATVAKRLADEYRILLVDMPNHGRSPWTDTVDYVQMADQVAGFIQREGPATVLGHSMGGKIAMLMALRHPELVERLVVVDISPGESPEVSSFAHFTDAMLALDLDRLETRQQAEQALAAAVPDPTVRSFLLQNLRRAGGWHWQLNLSVLGAHLKNVGGWPDTGDLQYDGPTLWMRGADSPYVRDEDRPAMRALFPSVQLVTVKKSGHWVHAEQPEAFYQVLHTFLEKTR